MKPHSKGRFRIEIEELEQRAVPAMVSCQVGTLLPAVQSAPVMISCQPATTGSTGEAADGHAYGLLIRLRRVVDSGAMQPGQDETLARLPATFNVRGTSD
jgi:hypothetical protein